MLPNRHVNANSSGYDGHPGDKTKGSDVTINAWDLTPAVFDNMYFVKVIKVVCKISRLLTLCLSTYIM